MVSLMLKKILILSICVIFLIGCGEISLKTYENDRFTFKFSPAWHSANEYAVLEDRGINIDNIILALLKREQNKIYSMNIVYEVLSLEIEDAEFIEKHVENAEELQGYELISKKDITWGGFDSVIHDYRGVNSQKQKVEYLQTFAYEDNISYSITVSSLDFIPDAMKNEFTLILQSFEFKNLETLETGE